MMNLNESTKVERTTETASPVECLVSCFDKFGTLIKAGDNILIENARRDISENGIVQQDGKILLTTGRESGKYVSVSTYLDAIWWCNDTPANWLTVLDS